MNKRLFFLTAAALAFAACGNESEDMNGQLELRLTSGVQTLTRAASDADTQEETIVGGEEVSVWVDDAGTVETLYDGVTLTADGSNGFSGTAMYFPQSGNSVDIYAIHSSEKPQAFGDFTFSVAASQAEESGYVTSDLLYAAKQDQRRTESEVPLTFYHMLSKLELAIVSGAGAPELAATDAVILAGAVTEGAFSPVKTTEALMAEQAVRADMIAPGTATGDITLGQTTSTDFEEANVNYNEAVIIPQDMGGKTIQFTLADGGTMTYAFPQGTVFESGKKYRFHITLNLTGLEVTSSIYPWEAVAAVSGEALL